MSNNGDSIGVSSGVLPVSLSDLNGNGNQNGSGKSQSKSVDEDADGINYALLDLIEQGYSKKAACQILGISNYNLKKRIKTIQDESAIILQYRPLQSLQLTALQGKILENITDDKIEEASLKDLVIAFKVLKDAELGNEEDPENRSMKGLVGYLIELEKREIALKNQVADEQKEKEIIDGEFTNVNVSETNETDDDIELAELRKNDLSKFRDE